MATAPVVGSGIAAATPLMEKAELIRVGNGFPPLTDAKEPGELADEQLAHVVSDGLVKLATDSEKLKPYFFELRDRFHKKSVNAEIHGCRTWDEFCTRVLKRTRRAVNYLLSGGNPVTKRNPQGNGTAETPSAENGKSPFAITQSPIDGDIAWSKQDASQRMLSWNVGCLKEFSPAQKREVAEDLIAKLRDEMEFEAPEPPPIMGDPVPEPDPGTLEELRQGVLRMADVDDIKSAVDAYVTDLLTPVLANHPHSVRHSVNISVRRTNGKCVDADFRDYIPRVAPGDWVEFTEGCGNRLQKLVGQPLQVGRVVAFDLLQRPKIRWYDGQEWSKPYSLGLADDGEVRVLFDWQAAEKYPEAFSTYPSDPEPPSPSTTPTTEHINSEQ